MVAVDALGNRTTSSTVNVKIADPTPVGPTTTIACDGLACPSGFVKGPVEVTLAAIDGGTGVDSTHYTTDGTDPDPSSPAYTAPFTLTDTTTVKFRSYDSRRQRRAGPLPDDQDRCDRDRRPRSPRRSRATRSRAT